MKNWLCFCLLVLLVENVFAEVGVGGVAISGDGSIAVGGVATPGAAVGGVAVSSNGSVAIGGVATSHAAVGGVGVSRNGSIAIGGVATAHSAVGGMAISAPQTYAGGYGVTANNQGNRDRFAAISYSPQTGRQQSSWDYDDLASAEEAANRACGVRDCRIVAAARNGCAAAYVATGSSYNIRANFGPGRRQTEDWAYRSCLRDFGDCQRIESVCTTGALP